MPITRLPTGTSDPISYTCTCGVLSSLATSEPSSSTTSLQTSSNGLVVLFYRYFDCPPALPTNLQTLRHDPTDLQTFHTSLTHTLNLGGKIRVSVEGFNITVGGTTSSINAYIIACLSHWSFSGLDLSTPPAQKDFFKPTPGCACVFGGNGVPANVRITEEITPMGVSGYVPKEWEVVESLEPERWHGIFLRKDRGGRGDGKGEGEVVLLDVRNHYESRIGYFMDPRTGEPAMRPEIRRFSQWPLFVRRYLSQDEDSNLEAGDDEQGGRQIMTYCTGGIRCEKGVRFLAENMKRRKGDKVYTLKGGIAAYLMWMDEEIKNGRKTPEESLFRGKNYVFDARGSTGLMVEDSSEPVSNCVGCGKSEDRLSKCISRNCHLILVVCEECERGEKQTCCADCKRLDDLNGIGGGSRPICECEREREERLWAGEKPGRVKRRQEVVRKAQRRSEVEVRREKINVQVKTFG